MSKTYIPIQVRKDLWIAAAGRCEFRGCNMPISRSFITQERVVLGEYCHIISDSQIGPRGDKFLSKKLAKSPENLMLCCPGCHKTIDDTILKGNYNIELLQDMKITHERNIDNIYNSTNVRNGIVLIVVSRINSTISQITPESAQFAIMQNSNYSIFPVYPPEIINLSNIADGESSSNFYKAAKEKLKYRISSIIDRMSDWEIEHLDIFALAQIPLLAYLGYCIGDRIDCTVYQAQRNLSNKWLWPRPNTVQRPVFSTTEVPIERCEEIAIILSISATVIHKDITEVLGDVPIIDLTVDYPSTEVVDKIDVQRDFAICFRSLMSTIFEKQRDSEVHLFPAIPNSLAIELGRCLNPHAINKTWVWNRVDGKFIKALSLQE